MPKKLTHEEYVQKLKLENPTIEILSKYNGNKNYIKVRCKIDGTIWNTKPNWLKAGKGCQTCYNNRRGKGRVKGVEKFIEESRLIHGGKYDYSKVNYINDTEKVCVICPQHGEFWISPAKHLRYNQGCPTCGRRRIDTKDFIERVKSIHGDKYDYSKVIYTGRFKDITIICPIHGEFKQKPDKHLCGQGCPKCNESKNERLVKNFLIEKNVSFETQKKFSWLGRQSLDFYLPDYNIAIECQGEQHFIPIPIFNGEEGLKVNRQRDIEKYEKCVKNNIKIYYFINNKKFFKKITPYNKNNVIFLENLNNFKDFLIKK